MNPRDSTEPASTTTGVMTAVKPPLVERVRTAVTGHLGAGLDRDRKGLGSIARAGVAMAPRPTNPTACASRSRSVTGPSCNRAAHRGRCQIMASAADSASTPEPAGRPSSTVNSSRRSRGAAVE